MTGQGHEYGAGKALPRLTTCQRRGKEDRSEVRGGAWERGHITRHVTR